MNPPPSPLDPTPDEIRRWGRAAIDHAAEYLGSIRDCSLYPDTDAASIRSRLSQDLPHDGIGFDRTLETFREVIGPLSRQNAHPRMFGYVQAPGLAIAAIADLLASTLNANLTAWRSAPAAVEVERITLDWLKEIIGFDRSAGGVLVSGGSMANFSALAAARQTKAPADFAERGASSLTRAVCLYASSQAHHSISKAAAILGIGRKFVRQIQVDSNYRIDPVDLRKQIERDRAAGHLPVCVVASAGTVVTGAIDPLAEIAEIAREFDLWMHVDACYGGFARLAPSARSLFDGIAQADSVALDPHKWLYLPVSCGCILYRDPAAARATFGYAADYTRMIAEEADEAFAFWDYGPELSRRFRALALWMTLQSVGLNAFADAIEHNIVCAQHLEQLVQASEDFEMMTPARLSIFCFRYLPPALKARRPGEPVEQEIDRFNEQLLVALQRDGSSYLSNGDLRGRFVLRGCAINYRTTKRDMEILLEDLRRVATHISTVT
jgi:aromatic-L-amino-acid decarboxylase